MFAITSGASEDPRFWAGGISLIAHTRNPHAPSVHMNTRMVVTTRQWFGGGADLTPVLDARRSQEDPDTIAFHAAMKKACDAHPSIAPYDKYKAWCDEYFFLKHRNEPRGVGGVFFDDLSEGGAERCFALTQAVGNAFSEAYLPIIERRRDTPYVERERDFRIRVPESGQDELSQMGASLNRLISSMQSNLQHIGKNAEDVASKSRHMAGTAQQVSPS